MSLPDHPAADQSPIPCTVAVPWVPPTLGAELAIPPHADLRGVTFTAAPAHPEWAGYAHTAFYLVVPWDEDEPPPWPYMQMFAPDDGRLIVTWQVWLSQVRYHGLPLVAERRWHPTRGLQSSLVSLLSAPSTIPDDDVLRAWRGFQFLDQQWPTPARGGRPERFPTRAAFISAIHAMYTTVDAQGWRHHLLEADDDQLAEWLGCGPTTLYKALGKWNITLDDIRQRRV